MLLVQEKATDRKAHAERKQAKAVAHAIGSPHGINRSPQLRSRDAVERGSMKDDSAYGNDALPPVELEVGETREDLNLVAGAKLSRRYILQGNECVSWVGNVLGGYTIDLTAKVKVLRGSSQVLLGARRLNLVGVDKSRVVCERQRNSAPTGYLDLGGEHQGCIDTGGPEGSAVLILEMDNAFSYFNGKFVRLHITKTVRKPSDSSDAQGVRASNGVACGEQASQAVSTPSRFAGSTISRSISNSHSPHGSSAALADLANGEGDESQARLRSLLAEALRLCPHDAAALREHLRAAQAHLTEYMTRSEKEDEGRLELDAALESKVAVSESAALDAFS